MAEILQEAKRFTLDNYKKGGLTTKEIDDKISFLLEQEKVKPSFLNYTPSADRTPFSGNACISVNEEIVHGVPSNKILKEEDIVSVDLGVIYENLYTDASISFILGEGGEEDNKLIEAAKKSLYEGIRQVRVGSRIGDIGNAIERKVKEYGFSVVKNYCGHGVGYDVHEDPSIPNYGEKGKGEEIREGMVFALEPMVVAGSGKIVVGDDGWTVKTADGERSSHWEHSVVVTKDGPVILTEVE